MGQPPERHPCANAEGHVDNLSIAEIRMHLGPQSFIMLDRLGRGTHPLGKFDDETLTGRITVGVLPVFNFPVKLLIGNRVTARAHSHSGIGARAFQKAPQITFRSHIHAEFAAVYLRRPHSRPFEFAEGQKGFGVNRSDIGVGTTCYFGSIVTPSEAEESPTTNHFSRSRAQRTWPFQRRAQQEEIQ